MSTINNLLSANIRFWGKFNSGKINTNEYTINNKYNFHLNRIGNFPKFSELYRTLLHKANLFMYYPYA